MIFSYYTKYCAYKYLFYIGDIEHLNCAVANVVAFIRELGICLSSRGILPEVVSCALVIIAKKRTAA